MYTVPEYVSMIGNRRRFEAYATALSRAVTPGSLVVEVGTGIGVFAVMARQLGARRVIAIEPNDAISVAKLVAEANGVDNIEFIQAAAKDVSLAERADVVVADLRGALPVGSTYLEAMIDVRRRFLRPGGTLIPAVDTLFAAVVHTPRRYTALHPQCVATGAEVSLDAVERFTVNTWTKDVRVEPKDLLTESKAWTSIDYHTLDDPNVAGRLTWTVGRTSVGHGLAMWFDGTLTDGVTVSNAPEQPDTAWGRMFFPFEAPVELQEGDRIDARIRAEYVAGDYVWSWDTDVHPADSPKAYKARFRQSTFYGVPIDADQLRRGAGDTVPRLREDGQIERSILQAMDGQTPNEDIASRLVVEFPRRFQTFASALGRVGQVARKFGEST